MMLARVFLVVLAAALSLLAAPASAAGPFDNWAALVVAGDFRAHDGAPSPVFDNARRDLVTALKQMGFAANHIQQYSARPELDPQTKPLRSDGPAIYAGFEKLTETATGGCFVYFTSHGAPLGILVGDQVVAIRSVGDIIDNSCHDRPTVAIISACFSGMFIPVLRADNRMILTASRPDRTSFGCGEDLKYTFFDQCVLETLPMVQNFSALADKVKDCVAEREMKEGATPPSEPQVYIGKTIAPALAQTYTFTLN
ncbi:MAG TPA: C13 family peptidase [Micropepsaceae bacterium]|jgi:hypothetical protein